MQNGEPWPLPSTKTDFSEVIDGARIEVSRNQWGILVAVLRGANPKFLELSEKQAAGLVAGLRKTLGD